MVSAIQSPLQNAKGEFDGVLLASINPYYFSMIFQEVSLGKKSLVYLADFNGTIFSGMLGGQDMGLDKTIRLKLFPDLLIQKIHILKQSIPALTEFSVFSAGHL
jgi:hypothetical protein